MQPDMNSQSSGIEAAPKIAAGAPPLPACPDIGKLYERFEFLNNKLMLFHKLNSAQTWNENSTKAMRQCLEGNMDAALFEMLSLSERVSQLQSSCYEHLRMKAKILLERMVPEDDDVSLLARSICNDLVYLQASD